MTLISQFVHTLNIHLIKYYHKQFVFKHSAISLFNGGVQGSAVQKFQTKVNVNKISLFTIVITQLRN